MSPQTPANQTNDRCVCDVYTHDMARTNIDIDEEAVKRVMERYGFTTMREAVNFALNRLARPRPTLEEILSLEGSGWSGDLEEMRGQK